MEQQSSVMVKLPPTIRFLLDKAFRRQVLDKWSDCSTLTQFIQMYRVEAVSGILGLIGSWVLVNWRWLSHPVRVSWTADQESSKIVYILTSNSKNFTKELAIEALKELRYIPDDFPIATTNVQVLSDKEMQVTIGKQSKEQLKAFVEERDLMFSSSIKSTLFGTLFSIGIVNWMRAMTK